MLPPKNFFPALVTFNLFPLHMPLTLFGLDAPFGRFSRHTSRFNLNGNVAWAAMEIVSPVTFITTLCLVTCHPLTLPARMLAGLYLVHYVHRAVVSPLLLSPKRSPLHISVPVAGAIFNLVNGYVLAIGLAFYPPQTIDWTFLAGVFGWLCGFVGNVYHDEILNDLRRPVTKRVVTGRLPEDDNPDDTQRYKVPRGGLFKCISFPNYFCEWFEWAAWAFAASPQTLISLPPPSSPVFLTGPAHSFVSLVSKIYWPKAILSPGWTFLLAEITSMIPRALSGHAWYKMKFGDRYPKERKAVIPGLL